MIEFGIVEVSAAAYVAEVLAAHGLAKMFPVTCACGREPSGLLGGYETHLALEITARLKAEELLALSLQ